MENSASTLYGRKNLFVSAGGWPQKSYVCLMAVSNVPRRVDSIIPRLMVCSFHFKVRIIRELGKLISANCVWYKENIFQVNRKHYRMTIYVFPEMFSVIK